MTDHPVVLPFRPPPPKHPKDVALQKILARTYASGFSWKRSSVRREIRVMLAEAYALGVADAREALRKKFFDD